MGRHAVLLICACLVVHLDAKVWVDILLTDVYLSVHPSRCQSMGRHTVLLMFVRPSRCQSMGRHTVLEMSACLCQSIG